MNGTAMIVSIISVIGALILVTSRSQFRNLGMKRMLRLALIWAAIIVGMVLLIQVSGFRIAP
jgi:hypothetical protein